MQQSKNKPALTQAESDRKLAILFGIDHFNKHFNKFINADLYLKNIFMPEKNVVCLVMSGVGIKDGTLLIRPSDCANDQPFLTRSENLCFSYLLDKQEDFTAIHAFFGRYLCARLRGATIDVILECFDEERLRTWRRDYDANAADTMRKAFGDAEQWRLFFCRRALERNIDGTIRVLDSIFNINHREMECRFATLPQDRQLTYFHNYPWARQAQGRRRASHGCGAADTDIGETDMIMGPRKKLEAALENASANTRGAEMIWVNTTCISDVVGDDFEDLIARTQNQCGIPVFCSGPKTNVLLKSFEIMIEKYRGGDHAARTKHSIRKNVINLIGFPCTAGADEVMDLLTALGIRINVRMLPEILFRDFENIGAARLNVLYPLHHFEKLYDAALSGIDIECLREPSPYGMNRTKNWLRALALKTGTESKFEKAWNNSFSLIERRWDQLRKEASQYTLAFVIDRFDLDALFDPGRNFAIDPAHFIQEMGFGLRFIAFTGEGASGIANAADALDMLENPANCEAVGFSSEQELREHLESGGIHAVYSDFFFDDRIAKAGKPQFSLSNFEMGIQGAVRTLESLLRICRLPFFSRYRKYIFEPRKAGDNF